MERPRFEAKECASRAAALVLALAAGCSTKGAGAGTPPPLTFTPPAGILTAPIAGAKVIPIAPNQTYVTQVVVDAQGNAFAAFQAVDGDRSLVIVQYDGAASSWGAPTAEDRAARQWAG